MPYSFDQYFSELPIISILRGIHPENIENIGQTLLEHGNRCIEVPLNSPRPYESIERLAKIADENSLCGAGTVTDVEQVQRIYDVGARLVVSPNCNVDVIQKSIELGMTPVPGIATPSEAFKAIDAGAKALKLFPATSLGIDFMKAIRTVVPNDIAFVATGGINPTNIVAWLRAGALGAGIGSDIYKPGFNTNDIVSRINAFRDAIAKR